MRECTHEDETLALGERFQNWGWKGGRVEGRTLHRLNCDFCDSMMDRIGEQGVEGWKGGGRNRPLMKVLSVFTSHFFIVKQQKSGGSHFPRRFPLGCMLFNYFNIYF